MSHVCYNLHLDPDLTVDELCDLIIAATPLADHWIWAYAHQEWLLQGMASRATLVLALPDALAKLAPLPGWSWAK